MSGDWRAWLDEVSKDIHFTEGRTLLEGFHKLAEAVEAVEKDEPMFCSVCDAQLVGGQRHYAHCHLGKALEFLRGVGDETTS